MIKINKTSNKYNLKYEYEVKSIKMFFKYQKVILIFFNSKYFTVCASKIESILYITVVLF